MSILPPNLNPWSFRPFNPPPRRLHNHRDQLEAINQYELYQKTRRLCANVIKLAIRRLRLHNRLPQRKLLSPQERCVRPSHLLGGYTEVRRSKLMFILSSTLIRVC